MPGNRSCLILAASCLFCAAAEADLVTARIGPETQTPGKLVVTGGADGKTWKVRVDLSGLPNKAKIYRAYLYAKRSERLTGREEWGLTNILICPLMTEFSELPAPLKLVGPWYDRFEATDVVRNLLKSPGVYKGFSVEAFPKLDARSICLDIEYEGKLTDPPPQPTDLRAFHRAGQTFITWKEVEKVVDDDRPTWRRIRTALENLDDKHIVRYRVYRSEKPITAKGLREAHVLAEVKPLSCYNVNGRSADQAFGIMRKRMLEDMDYAKGVSKKYYAIPRSARDAVVIDRFVVPANKGPLANGTGLYVHHPAKAGESYYAVTTIINGRENTVALEAGKNVAGPMNETRGAGRPVFQRTMDMRVLFDYAGKRLQYVQWCAPPLSNLPNQYYNWSVFIPEGVKLPAGPKRDASRSEGLPPLELVLTGNGMFRRPRWPHRLDTVLVSPQDRHAGGSLAGKPIHTWYYGYHESAGTLRSFKQGTIQPYTWRRMSALLKWASEEFGIDTNRVTCAGDRGYSATAALHFGMRHPEVFSLVYTCKGMPNPAAIPVQAKLASWHRRASKTEVYYLEDLIGRKEWGLRTDAGENVWAFLNLTAGIEANPNVLRPMLSYGGRGRWNWPPIAKFLRALAGAGQPVISEGTWGALAPPGLKNPGAGRSGLNVRRNRPIPVFTRCSSDYQGGRNGDGGQTNYGVWWLDKSIIDEPDRFQIVLTGNAGVDVRPRRTEKFLLKPGEKVDFRVEPLARTRRRGDKPVSGTAVADQKGLVTIPKVNVREKARLTITRSQS